MKVFAIADLHLSGEPPAKPMDVFGDHWQGHWHKIKRDWLEKVSDNDTVLLAGDTSWGMRWQEAWPDLTEIIALPGRKIVVRGNHDYWWQTVAKMSKATDEKLLFMQNNFFSAGDWAICGSRGWSCPGDANFGSVDKAIYLREVGRLRLSLEAAEQAGYRRILVMLHYPPTDIKMSNTGFTELLDEFKVELCVYGHLHGESAKFAPVGLMGKTILALVACDATNFALRQILDATGRICDLHGE